MRRRAARLIRTGAVEKASAVDIDVRVVLRLGRDAWPGTILEGLSWEGGGRNVPVIGEEVQLIERVAVIGAKRRCELILIGPGGVLVEVGESQVGAGGGSDLI